MSIRSWLALGLLAISTVSYSQVNNSRNIEVKIGTGTIYDITQKQAERRIRKLAKTADLEDAWMYYNNQLIDIGHSETKDNVAIHISKDFEIDSGKTVTFYHIHPNTKLSPPSITDIVNNPRDYSRFKNNKIIMRVFDEKHKWEYDVTDRLSKELSELTNPEQASYIYSKINIAYDPTNNHLIFGVQPYPYKPTSIKEHLRIMQDIGVNLTYKRN